MMQGHAHQLREIARPGGETERRAAFDAVDQVHRPRTALTIPAVFVSENPHRRPRPAK